MNQRDEEHHPWTCILYAELIPFCLCDVSILAEQLSIDVKWDYGKTWFDTDQFHFHTVNVQQLQISTNEPYSAVFALSLQSTFPLNLSFLLFLLTPVFLLFTFLARPTHYSLMCRTLGASSVLTSEGFSRT